MARAPQPQDYLPATGEETLMRTIEEQEPDTDPEDMTIAGIISELGASADGSKVNVYAVDSNNGRSFLRTFAPDEYSIEFVQKTFGAGKYEVRVYRKGRLIPGGRSIIKIGAPARDALESQSQGGSDTGAILATMQQGFERLGGMFAQALAGLAANQPKPKTTMEMLQEMTMMKELLGLGQSQAAPPQDPLAMINLAVELSEKIRPREGEPSAGEIILKAVENFAPAINEMVQQSRQNAAPAMPPGMVPAHPGAMLPPPVPAPIEAPQPAQEQQEMNIAFQIYCRTLLGAAAQDADPSTYANNILDLVPEETVLEFVNKPDWFGEVVKILPDAAKFAPWFAQLRTDILELTKPEDGSSVETQANSMPQNAG